MLTRKREVGYLQRMQKKTKRVKERAKEYIITEKQAHAVGKREERYVNRKRLRDGRKRNTKISERTMKEQYNR